MFSLQDFVEKDKSAKDLLIDSLTWCLDLFLGIRKCTSLKLQRASSISACRRPSGLPSAPICVAMLIFVVHLANLFCFCVLNFETVTRCDVRGDFVILTRYRD